MLDQRARQGLAERPLRQPQFVRGRAAFVVALVAGDSCHRDIDAAGMLGQILGGSLRLRVRAWGGTKVKFGTSNSNVFFFFFFGSVLIYWLS